MYITITEATLIHRQHYRPSRTADAADPPIYVREYNGQRILTLKAEPSRHMSDATRYGIAYWDARGVLCVVPDDWNDADAQLAAEARWPDPPIPDPQP